MLSIEWKRLIEKFEKAAQKAAERENEYRKRDQNLIAGPLDVLNNQFASYKNQQESSERSKRTREIATIWGIFITAGFTLITAVIFYCQLHVFERSDLTFEKTLVATNRAWLASTHFEFLKSIDADGGPVITAHFRNVGRSPALDLKNGAGWIPAIVNPTKDTSAFPEVLPNWHQIDEKIRTACEANQPIIGGQTVFPDETRESNMIATAPDPLPDKALIQSGKIIIVVTGCLTYKTFDETRHSGFCQYVTKTRFGQWEFLSCPGGNFAN